MKIFALITLLMCTMYIADAQNVGIGTTDPEMPLHVEGGIGTGLRITRAGTTVNLDLKAAFSEASIGTATNHGLRFLTNNSLRMEISNMGNVSIGTLNGPEKLNLNGAIRLGNTSTNSTGTIRYFQNDFEGYNGTDWLSLTSGSDNLWQNTNVDGIHYDVGNVGIGTTPTENAKLFVLGLTKIGSRSSLETRSTFANNTSYTVSEIKAESSTTQLFGTEDINKGVEILGMGELPDPFGGDLQPEINLYNIEDEQAISLDFVNNKGTVISEGLNIQAAGTSQVNLRITNNVNESSEIRLLEGSSTRVEIRGNEGSVDGAVIKLYDQNSNLSIELDADYNGKGRIITDEIEIKGGSDFAENFDIVAGSKPLPGMVVSIDPRHEGKLMISQSAIDKKVAGIISGANGINPGMRMGQKNSIANGEYPIALSGRVYAYASIEGGTIQPGDLLTTSSIEGHVMKVPDISKAYGAIIGKAMTKVSQDGELVLVLVNLH